MDISSSRNELDLHDEIFRMKIKNLDLEHRLKMKCLKMSAGDARIQ